MAASFATTEKPMTPGRASLCMLICGIMWSTGGLFVKLIPWHPVVISGARSLIAALIVLLYLKGPRQILANRRTMLAGLFLTLVMVLYVWAIKLTTAANAIVLQYLSPVFIILINLLVFQQKATLKQLIAVGISVCGIALFFFDQLSLEGLIGCILAILSGVFYAAYYVASNHLNSQQETLSATFFGQFYTTLFAIPFAVASPPVLSGASLVNLLLLGVIQLGLPYVIYSRAIRYCAPLNAMLICMVEPLLNPVWVFLAVGEVPGFFALMGAIVVISVVTWWSITSLQDSRKQTGEGKV